MKKKTRGSEEETLDAVTFIGIKSIRAKGKRITSYPVKKLTWIEEPAEFQEPLPPAQIIEQSAEPAPDVKNEKKPENPPDPRPRKKRSAGEGRQENEKETTDEQLELEL
jgi:hypothetical protein